MFARVPPARVAAFKEQTALKRTTNAEDVARQVVISVNLTQLPLAAMSFYDDVFR